MVVNDASHHTPKVITDQRLGTNSLRKNERVEAAAHTLLGFRMISGVYLDRLCNVCECDYDRRLRVMGDFGGKTFGLAN